MFAFLFLACHGSVAATDTAPIADTSSTDTATSTDAACPGGADLEMSSAWPFALTGDAVICALSGPCGIAAGPACMPVGLALPIAAAGTWLCPLPSTGEVCALVTSAGDFSIDVGP